MPAVNPRIFVSLEPETVAAIERFARATGQTKSKVCGSILNAQTAALHKLAAVLEASANLSDRAKAEFKNSLSHNLQQTEQIADEMMAVVDDMASDAAEVKESASSNRTARRAQARVGEARP